MFSHFLDVFNLKMDRAQLGPKGTVMKELPPNVHHSRGVRISIAFLKCSFTFCILMAIIEAINRNVHGTVIELIGAYYCGNVLREVRNGSGEWLFAFKRPPRCRTNGPRDLNQRGSSGNLQSEQENNTLA